MGCGSNLSDSGEGRRVCGETCNREVHVNQLLRVILVPQRLPEQTAPHPRLNWVSMTDKKPIEVRLQGCEDYRVLCHSYVPL